MSSTRPGWSAALVLVGAGLVSALQLGKATAVLPDLQQQLHLDLGAAAWLVSAFGIVGAVAAIPIGRAVDRSGSRRMLLLGLALQALACAGATCWPSVPWVLGMRVLEGVGFQFVVVAAPALLAVLVRGRLLPAAMSAWSTFMPLGLASALLGAPLLAQWGWQGVWWLGAGLAIAFAGLVLVTVPRTETCPAAPGSMLAGLAQLWRARLPMLLALLFALFATTYFAVFGFLPLLLRQGLPAAGVGENVLSAVAIGASALGNVFAGALLARGVRPASLCAVAFALLAGCSILFFGSEASGWWGIGTCVVFGAVAGLIPTALLVAAPGSVPSPGLAGLLMGLLMQANNVGIVVGPALAGSLATRFGWTAVAVLVVLLAAIGMAAAVRVNLPRASTPQWSPP